MNANHWAGPRRRDRLGLRLAAVAVAGATVATLAPTAAVAAGVGVPSAVAEAGRPGPSVDLGPELRTLVERGGATAALGEVRENGRRPWRDAAGVVDLDSGRAVRTDSRFRIGSVTKTFVSTVVLQLADEGRLRLDDPVDRYLPGVVPNGGAITLRQLLQHTSGLFDYLEDPRFLYHDEASLRAYLAEGRWTDFRPEELVSAAVGHPPYFEPGQGWYYSNTNYILTGMIIRKVTGRTWQREVERRIVEPLHLDSTTFPNSSARIPGPHAHGYIQLPEGPADVTRLNPTVADAAGNGISTTADLDRFHAALFGGKLLTPARLAEMTTVVPAPTIAAHYGLGLIRYDLPCGEVWGHTGGIPGYNTILLGAKDGSRQFALSFNLLEGAETDETGAAIDALFLKAACGADGAGAASAAPSAKDTAGRSPLKLLR
ncbi:serine hydrolase domain-containing protein [Streptomyces sp. XY431]|uniref:serine hydrolase domain-containing protein n=1 Tax=Streptomyces sp. XY431 TaxID=1415562 RepID=UPI0006AEA275|nr:serine hydrolase domain-containing protein [Streptomyces sp. XY431]